jgi:hypothetical protein
MLYSHFFLNFFRMLHEKDTRKTGGTDNDWELTGSDIVCWQLNYSERKRKYAGISTGSLMQKRFALSCTFISLFQKVGKCSYAAKNCSEMNDDYRLCERLHKFISKKATATRYWNYLFFKKSSKFPSHHNH